MEAAARLLRPRNRKRNKSGETSPRRGRVRPSRENSGTSGSLSAVDEADVVSSRSLPNFTPGGITRTSSLPGLPDRISIVSSDDVGGTAVPSPLGDHGNMSTDVSDSFKRAFQEMATEREALRKAVDEHKVKDQALADLKTDHSKLKDSLEEARAQHKKELDRAVASSKTVSSLQADVQSLNSTISNKAKEIMALKEEIAASDKKRVTELMQREKTTDSIMLRKAREIETLKKQLDATKKRLKDAENDAIGFQKTADRTAKTLQNLRDSLRAEEMKRVTMETNLKKAQADLLERRKEMSDMSTKFLSAQDEAARLTREVRALERAAESAKGQGSDAESRISDLERKLSLRTDELKAAEAASKKSQSDADKANGELEAAQRSLELARSDVERMRESIVSSARKSTSHLSVQVHQAETKAAEAQKALEKAQKSHSTELADVQEAMEKEVADQTEKLNEMREELANAKLSWGREKRDLALQVNQAEDALLAKEREIRSLSIKAEEAKANAEDSKWHLDRANKKLHDARDAAAQAEKEAKEEISDLRGRVSDVQATFRAAEKRASVAELKLDEAKVSLEQAEERLARAAGNADEWKAKSSEASKGSTEMRVQLNDLLAANESMKSDMQKLKDSLKQSEAENEKSKKDSQNVNEELGKCKKELVDTKARFEIATTNVKTLETTMAERNGEVEGLRTQVASLDKTQSDLTSKSTKVTELESELLSARTEVSSLEERLSTAESTAAGLAAQRDTIIRGGDKTKSILAKAEKDLEDLLSKVALVELEKEKFEKDVSDLRVSVSEKDSLLQKASKEAETAQRSLDGLQIELQEAKQLLQLQTKDSAGLSKEVTDLVAKISRKDSELAESKSELRGLREDITKLTADLAAAEAASTALNDKSESLLKERLTMEKEVKDSVVALEFAKEEVSALEARLLESKQQFLDKENALRESLRTAENACEEKSSQIEAAQTEIENIKLAKADVDRHLEEVQQEMKSVIADRDELTLTSTAKYNALCEEREVLLAKIEERNADVERLTKKAEEASEQSLSLANEIAESQQLADEAQSRAGQVEDELAAEIQELKWALNEETLRADNAEAETQTLQERGRTIYSKIEEFGAEAEARVVEAETELESALQDIGVLQERIAELNNELSESKDKEEEMKRKYDEALGQKSSLLMDKEAAERRFEMSQSEMKFHTDRLRTLEGQNKDLNDDLDKSKVTLRDVEDKLLRLESRAGTEKERMEELQSKVERMRGFESKFNASEMEIVRLRSQVDQATAAQAMIEMERDQTERRIRELEQRHTQEKVQLMAERASFAESARKAQTDLDIRRDEIEHYRSAMSSTGSGRHNSDGGGVKNNIVVGGATAFVGGVGLFAFKMLAKSMAQTKT